MLYSLGPLVVEVAPFNAHEVDRRHAADFAAKELLGRRKSREFVGTGDEVISLRGRLYPHKLGGLEDLALLNEMRESGVPQFLLRGDGLPMGWFLVERVQERSRHLDGRGVGQEIDVEIELVRDDPPSPSSFIDVWFSFF
ncbi:MAG TPA: phage tail protein [Xanthobacteraceae bacterium]|nr:phage tail protein [Xanthobacteraceae bacterium]